MKKYEKNARGE